MNLDELEKLYQIKLEYDKLKEQQKEFELEKVKINQELIKNDSSKAYYNSQSHYNHLMINMRLKNANFIKKYFGKKQISRQISEEIKKLNIQKEDLKKRLEELEILLQDISKKLESYQDIADILEIIQKQEDVLTITDSKDIEQKTVNDERFLVHCTNFFPKDRKILTNYEGKKEHTYEDFEFDGDVKTIKFRSHRNSVHFVVNHAAISTAKGELKISNPKFIILEPESLHETQFVGGEDSDKWTYGSIQLANKPILLVREDCYDEIPQDQLEQFNIIKYSGSYEKCVDNLLKFMGVKPNSNYYSETKEHSNSIECLQEELLEIRGQELSFVTGKTDVHEISNEQFVEFIKRKLNEIESIGKGRSLETGFHKISFSSGASVLDNYGKIFEYIKDISEKTEIPFDFLKIMIIYGISKEDNKFKFKSDDEIYEQLKIFKKTLKMEMDDAFKYLKKEFPIDIEQLKKTYVDYIKDKEQLEKERLKEQKKALLISKKQQLESQKQIKEDIGSKSLGYINITLASLIVILIIMCIFTLIR